MPEAKINRDNINDYLKAFAKEYRKINGLNMPLEIVLTGGASVLINYGFREMTTDIDAIISNADAVKSAVMNVAEKYNLPMDWINTDVTTTKSYSDKLREHSKYYRTFSNIVQVRTVSAEYLVAMKLRAGRQYKNDLSDIVGILAEQKENGHPLQYSDIDRAIIELYGSWNDISDFSSTFIAKTMETDDLLHIYAEVHNTEAFSRKQAMEIDRKYPGLINESNINDIIKKAQKNGDSK